MPLNFVHKLYIYQIMMKTVFCAIGITKKFVLIFVTFDLLSSLTWDISSKLRSYFVTLFHIRVQIYNVATKFEAKYFGDNTVDGLLLPLIGIRVKHCFVIYAQTREQNVKL